MGRNKARLRLGGRSMVARVRAVVRPRGWPVRVIWRDSVPRCGPIGGVFTALNTSLADIELFLACDMPFISDALLMKLLRTLGTQRPAAFTASDDGAGFPFALRVLTLPIVHEQIRRHRFSLQALAKATGAKLLRVSEAQRRELWNINTPEDWKRARH